MGAIVRLLDGASVALLWLSVLTIPVFAMAGGLGFQATGFLTASGGLLVFLVTGARADYVRALWPLALIVFTAWVGLSTQWSVFDKGFAQGNALPLVLLLPTLIFLPLTVLRLSERMRNWLGLTFIAVMVIGAAVMLADAASGYAVSMFFDPLDPDSHIIFRTTDAELNLGRGQVSFAVLAWPVIALMLARWKRGWVVAALFGGLLAVSAHLNNISLVPLTLLLSGGFAALGWRNPPLAIKLAFGLAIASLAFAPLIGIASQILGPELQAKLPLSWEHRLRMWAYSWELIRQAPLFGHGFDASRTFDTLTFQTRDGRDVAVMSLHPHNVGLQIWLETGLVGAVLGCALLAALARPVLAACRTPHRGLAAAGLIIATATASATTVGAWQHWWWALIALAVACLALLPARA